MVSRVSEAEANVAYFNKVIKYYNSKITFFYSIQDALDSTREEDREIYEQMQS